MKKLMIILLTLLLSVMLYSQNCNTEKYFINDEYVIEFRDDIRLVSGTDTLLIGGIRSYNTNKVFVAFILKTGKDVLIYNDVTVTLYNVTGGTLTILNAYQTNASGFIANMYPMDSDPIHWLENNKIILIKIKLPYTSYEFVCDAITSNLINKNFKCITQ